MATWHLASKSIPHQSLSNGGAEDDHSNERGRNNKTKKSKRLSWTIGKKKGKEEAYVADRSS